MKKIASFILLAAFAFAFAACGTGGTQEVEFQGFTMEIPSSWKAQKETLSEEYAIYENLNKKGHDYRLLLDETYGLLPKCEGDLEEAGAFMKKVTEDNASYSDVQEPVAGKFAGKYDMHIIKCRYHAINLMEEDAESDYPCKIIRIYMGERDVEIEFITAEGDFEAFDSAVKGAVLQ